MVLGRQANPKQAGTSSQIVGHEVQRSILVEKAIELARTNADRMRIIQGAAKASQPQPLW